jgi:hypothetical protein
VFDQASGFLSKHRYGKIIATVRTTWIPVQTRSSIRQVLQFKSRRPDDGPHGPDTRASDMEIAYIKSTVRTIIPWSGRAKPLSGNYLQRTCNRPNDRAPPFGRGSETGKNFSEILGQLIAQLSVRTAHDYRPDGA